MHGNSTSMANFVLVHGGFQGGWAYRRVAGLLRDTGHGVYTPTLTGLGDRSRLAHMQVNLDTHIADVANTVIWEDLSDIILLGHSYGGMVVTAGADLMPERIASLVYLDAPSRPIATRSSRCGPAIFRSFWRRPPRVAGYSSHRARRPCSIHAQAMTGHGWTPERLRIRWRASLRRFDCRGAPGARVIGLPQPGHSIMIDQPETLVGILNEILVP